MTSADWPARLIPRRSPALWLAAVVTVTAMACAIAARSAFLGLENGLGLSATYFPAFIIATLYAGPRWGWLALATALSMGYFVGRSVQTPGISREAMTVMYAASGAVTVFVAGALREALVSLDEAQARQRAAEGALDQTLTHLHLAQEAGDVGLYDFDILTGERWWSTTLYRNVGIDPKITPSTAALLEVVHPDDREMVRDANIAAALQADRVQSVEYRVIWPDGSLHWLLSRGELIRDDNGRPVRAVGVSIDVTDRRLAFERVAASEARFRALADSAPVLMWVSYPDGRREFVNQAYVDYLGVDYDAALAFDWRTRLHPEDHDRILAEQVAGESARKLFILEARYRRGDGEYYWVRSISQPRYAPSGEFNGFIGVGVDITAAKQAEKDLQHINDLLADRVQAALAERDSAEAALHRALKLEAVGQLTGGVAHDFNNLLTVIIGALDMIQRHPADAARRDRMIEAAQGAARRGERLTHQLLAFARRQNLKPEIVRIDDLLRENEPLLRRAVGEAVSMTLAPGAPGAVARTDPSQFEAALMNLVVNARDAVASGGAIRVETLCCKLAEGDVEETPPGDYVCLAVHDTGVGMDAKTLSRVFEPFFTTKEVGKGTGLGLSQIYGFARQSGGGVAIDSAPGKGASVSIYLPVVIEVAAAEVESAASPVAACGPALDVLLVEDDAAVGDMIAAMLEDSGHRVRRAEDARQALEILKHPGAVDLMLTDVVMPGALSGVDLAHQALALRPALPIILSSGYTGDTLKSAAAAPWPLLRKPYSSEDLSRTIEAVLEAATAQD